MKILNGFLIFFAFFACFSGKLIANDLTVSGIYQGNQLMAIVNGDVVQKGSKIGDIEVIRVESDHVVFKADSTEFKKYLKTVNGKKKRNKADISSNAYSSYSADYRLDARRKNNLNQALDYADKGDDILNQRIISLKDFRKAHELYDKAERELQYAQEKTTDQNQRKKIKTSIHSVLEQKSYLRRKRMEFEERVSEAIKKRNLVLGMTKSDVRKSWGVPYEINSSNYSGVKSEQWQYGKLPDPTVYLYFDEGILTSRQNL